MKLLTTLIKEERKNLKINDPKSITSKYLSFVTEPSRDSVFFLLSASLIVLLIFTTLISQFCYLKTLEISNSAGDLMQAIITFLLGILIFSAERYQEDQKTVRVFFRESKLWGLTALTIINLFSYFLGDFIFGTDNIFWKASLMISGLLACWLFYAMYKIIFLVLNRDKLIFLKDKLIYEDIDFLNDLSIQKRIWQNIFSHQFNTHYFAEYKPFFDLTDLEWKYRKILANQTWLVVDVDLSKINGVGSPNENENTEKDGKIILLKSYWDKIKEGDLLALVPLSHSVDNPIQNFYLIRPWIEPKDIKKSIISDLDNLLYQIGDQIITKNALRLEWLYDSLIKYIKKHSEGVIEMKLNFVLDLNKPNDAIGGFWSDGIWFYYDIQEKFWDLYGLTKKSWDIITLTEFTKFIYSIIFYSISNDDYPLIWISSRFIVELNDNEVVKTDNDLEHRIKVNNDNLFDFVLFPKIQKTTDQKNKDMLSKFVLLLLRGVLSNAIRKWNYDRFSSYLYKLSESETRNLGESFQKDRKEMLFGLVAWVLKQFPLGDDSQLTRRIITDILSSIRCSLVEWLNIFSSSLSRDGEWDTADWDIPSDGRVHMIDSRTWPEKSFILWLNLFHRENFTVPEDYHIPRDFRYLDLNKWLDNTEWLNGFAGVNVSVEAIGNIKQLLYLLKEKETVQSRNERLLGNLDSEKVSNFITDIKESYVESSKFLKSIFHPSSGVDLWETESMFWFNQFLEKVWFVDTSHSIAWMGWSFGRSFWEWQTRLVLDEVKKKMAITHIKNIDEIKDQIVNFSSQLSRPIIVLYGSRNYEVLDKLPLDERSWDREVNFRWKMHNIPVYEVFNTENDVNELLLIDLDKVEELIIQASKPSWMKTWGSSNIIPNFYFELENIGQNNDLLNEILNNPPEWLNQEYAQEEWYSSVEEYLQDRVQFKMFFSYRINIDENAGQIFKWDDKLVQSLED